MFLVGDIVRVYRCIDADRPALWGEIFTNPDFTLWLGIITKMEAAHFGNAYNKWTIQWFIPAEIKNEYVEIWCKKKLEVYGPKLVFFGQDQKTIKINASNHGGAAVSKTAIESSILSGRVPLE